MKSRNLTQFFFILAFSIVVVTCVADILQEKDQLSQDTDPSIREEKGQFLEDSAPSIRQRRSIRLSNADKNAIVNKHNQLRRRVAKGQEKRGKPGPQPSASNMRQLKWDDNLARAAATLTDRCKFAHDTKISAGHWKGYGQNLGAGHGSWNQVVDSWYNEVKDFPASGVNKYRFKSNTGHYSQVVWADTYAVGCAATKCSRGLSPIYACNYGTSGNFIGAPVYKIGTPASACARGTKKNDGLCTK